MVPKGNTKKLKQKQQNTEANNSTPPWNDFPNQIVNIVRRHPNLEKNINFGGVTKSWRTSPNHFNNKLLLESSLPWLQLSDPDASNTEKYRRHVARRGFINTPSMPWGCWCRHFLSKLQRYPWKDYVGCSNGILVAEAEPLYMYIMWNPIQREWYHLPLWDAKVPIKLAVLSSSPEDQNCTIMVLTGIGHPAFAFYKLKRPDVGWITQELHWTKQDCSLTDPHSLGLQKRSHIVQFTNAIGFKGKFYALSLQGTLAVLEEVDSVYKITALSSTRAVPSVSSIHFREYLLDSNGEILLVYLVSRKSSVRVVDHAEVHKLNLARLSWLKLESIGVRTVFVGRNCGMSVLASEVGCRRNCIYFRVHVADEWMVYDMESGNIIPGGNEGNPTTTE